MQNVITATESLKTFMPGACINWSFLTIYSFDDLKSNMLNLSYSKSPYELPFFKNADA